jgi:S1-C subfamily serine protease
VTKEWFDEAALIEQGIDEHRAAWLHEHFEELQMEELYLRDEATRDGWIGTPRYRKQVRNLRGESRETLGDDDYDLLLYASSRNNRVLLSDILQNSPAAAAGIEPGDVLLRYDDQAIFEPRHLLTATTQGAAGSTVAVDLMRNGQSLRVYVRRGPLGARIHSVRRFPSEGP